MDFSLDAGSFPNGMAGVENRAVDLPGLIPGASGWRLIHAHSERPPRWATTRICMQPLTRKHTRTQTRLMCVLCYRATRVRTNYTYAFASLSVLYGMAQHRPA